MNLAITIVAVVLVIVGVVFGKISKKEIQTSESPQVLSVEEETEEEEVTPTTASFQQDKTPTPPPSQRPSGPEAKPPSSNLSSFQYPSATIVSSSNASLVLNSTDNSDTITDWYKEKIKGEGMNVTSFVTTKTNDNVLNKLVGADGVREIRVEIKKDSGSSVINISVELKSS